MRIGIYGGSFNPIHYGHLRTAEEVLEKLSLNKALFIPAGKTPFEKPDLITAAHRYNMVKLAIAGNPDFQISGIEIKTKGKSFTVDTIRSLKEKYSDAELYLILGIDAFLDLPHWKQPDKLINLANIVIISRPGFPFRTLSLSPYLRNVPKKILTALDKATEDCISFSISNSKNGFLCRVSGLDISASNIRNLIMSGKNVKYLLPDSVENYIISKKLYIKQD